MAILINSLTDLQKIGVDSEYPLDGEYELTQDIDADGAVINPIGENTSGLKFSGIFDGMDYTLSNAVFHATGLFGACSLATIKNLIITGALSAYQDEGPDGSSSIVSGVASDSTFENISVQGTLEVNTWSAGPVIGSGANNSVSNCTSNIKLIPRETGWDTDVGGICGFLAFSTVDGCSSSGFVADSPDDSYENYETNRTGGIAGDFQECVVSNCSSSMSLFGSNYIGGIAGKISGDSGSITNCTASSDISSIGYTGGIAGLVSASVDTEGCEFTGTITLASKSEVSVVYMGGIYGHFSATGVHYIRSCQVSADIPGIEYSGGLAGYVDGSDLSIEDITVIGNIVDSANIPSTPYYIGGLVGFVQAVNQIRNCRQRGSVTGGYNMGGFLGVVDSASLIENCTSIGDVIFGDKWDLESQGNDSFSNVGGFAGGLYSVASVLNCYSRGRVEGVTNVGGFAGMVDSSDLDDCRSHGDVSAFRGHTKSTAGGFAGSISDTSIQKSQSTGSVYVWISQAGGFAGKESGASSVTNCWSGASVQSPQDSGGFVGVLSDGAIENCHSYGDVSVEMGTTFCGSTVEGTPEERQVGGFLGSNTSGTVTASYWDTESSGLTNSAEGTGKTTAEMKQQTTFSVWDFTDPWKIIEDETYPVLCLPLTASFSYEQDTEDRTEFTFTADSTPVDILYWEWDFGDSEIDQSDSMSTVHNYSQKGIYPVTMTVSDGYSDDSVTEDVSVTLVPIVPDFSVSRVSHTVFDFTDTSEGEIETRVWDFGDGSTLETEDAAVQHDFVNSGTYDVTLTVSDGVSQDTITKTGVVVIDPAVSVSDFTYVQDQDDRSLFIFTDNTSGTGLQRSWDFGDGTTEETDQDTITHNYDTKGVYTVTLTVSDDYTSDTVSQDIQVVVIPLIPSFTITEIGDRTFVFTCTSQGEIDSRTWDFGDGTALTVSGNRVDHQYSDPGIYEVSLSVTDGFSQDTAVNYTAVQKVCFRPDLTVAESHNVETGEYWRLYFDTRFHLIFETEAEKFRSDESVTSVGSWTLIEFDRNNKLMYVGDIGTYRRAVPMHRSEIFVPREYGTNGSEIAGNSTLKIDELKIWDTPRDLSGYFSTLRGRAGNLSR